MLGDREQLDAVLRAITVRAWRLHLETPGVLATVPMLRGVWGAALKAESEPCYHLVFQGGDSDLPRYVLRPAPCAARPAPAVELLLLGQSAGNASDRQDQETIWRAWDRACRQGLGPERRPFQIVAAVPLAWDGTPLQPTRTQPGFALGDLPWPTRTEEAACRLEFPAPLRLLRQGRLIVAPSLVDLALAALRRVCSLAGPGAEPLWSARRDWMELARSIVCEPWRGRRLDLVRYSGTQKGEVEMRGVAGNLTLPHGPGPLAPLLAAATWLHLGKGTVMGLGQVRIVPGMDQNSLRHDQCTRSTRPVE